MKLCASQYNIMEDRSFYLLHRAERRHWWHRARRAILEKVMNYYLSSESKEKSILDVGSGTGANYEFLSRFGNVVGLEPSQKAIEFCHERGFMSVMKGSITECPVSLAQSVYECVTCFDVLEHIEDEDAALECLAKVTKRGGLLFITVPAFSFLWSPFDEFSCHQRRYTVNILKKKIERHGFKVVSISYFNIFLFPLVFVVRKFESIFRIRSSEDDLRVPPALCNVFFFLIFQSEKYFLPHVRFPFGVSIICVAQKE